MGEKHNPTVAILASGDGTTAEAFIHATQDGRIIAEVGLVICNKPPDEAGIYSRIERLNEQYGLDIEVAEINSHTHPAGKVGPGQTLAESEAICLKLSQNDIAHVALMGYFRIVRGDLIETYGWSSTSKSMHEARMSNTHPGPLPETQGLRGIYASAKVLELGLPASKHTLHVVSADIDGGPKIAEHPVETFPTDTPQDLSNRVRAVEKAALPYALDLFLRTQASIAGLNS